MRGLLALFAALAPAEALAHASERMMVLTLPTERYILGAAATVALTALVVPLAPRLPALRPRRLADLPAPPLALTSWAACLALLALVAIGFLGPRDPLGNLLPLAIWTLLWVGLTLATMLLGDLFTQGGDGKVALTEGDILGPSEAFRAPMDYFAHAPHTAATLEKLAREQPLTLACMHGSAWRGDGAALLRALARSLEAQALALPLAA